MEATIKVSDFTRYPGPRFKRLGKGSGEEFRDSILIPALKEHERIVVDLDGTRGYGSSFLEEAFGGAVRKGVKITEEKCRIVSEEDSSLVEETWEYIKDASEEG